MSVHVCVSKNYTRVFRPLEDREGARAFEKLGESQLELVRDTVAGDESLPEVRLGGLWK